MNVLEMYGKEAVSVLVPLVTWVLNTFFKSRVKLQVANPHSYNFLVQVPLLNAQGTQLSPTQMVRTASFMLRNSGKEAATKVEIVFNWKPPCINIWPSRHYTEYVEPDLRYVLVFESLAPSETLGCELLAIN
ncbi:MAG: hypothetical protein KGQ77_10860, partial [Betaproteobacteria bacterium]|nr:hypothetical protein [Betaproteobacteria bacterium]